MKTRPRTLMLAAICTVTGAGGALGANALSSSAHDGHHARFHFGHHRGFDGLGRAVHATAVVPTRTGDFATVTFDRGVVKSVSGQDITLTEGTKTATYKDETITLPSDAKIRVFGVRDATLADVKEGMRAAVVQAPQKTLVLAAPARDTSGR